MRDPWPRDEILRELQTPPSIAEVADYVLAASPSHKTLELFAWYALLRDSLDRVSESMFPPGSTVAVTDAKIVECMRRALELRDQCFDFLNWIRTGYPGNSGPTYSNEHTLH